MFVDNEIGGDGKVETVINIVRIAEPNITRRMARDGDERLEKSAGGQFLDGGSSGKSCLYGDIVLFRQKLKKTLKDPGRT